MPRALSSGVKRQGREVDDLTAVLKGETATITITKPPSNEEFRGQRRRKQKISDDADKRTKKPVTSIAGVSGLYLQ
jgi:hypothetical protein